MSAPRQPGSARKAFARLLIFLGLLLLVAGIIMAVHAVDFRAGVSLPLAVLLGLLLAGIGAIWAGFALVEHHSTNWNVCAACCWLRQGVTTHCRPTGPPLASAGWRPWNWARRPGARSCRSGNWADVRTKSLPPWSPPPQRACW